MSYNSRPAINNIKISKLIKILEENKISCSYSSNNINLADDIDKLLSDNKIDKNIINQIYFELILFGKHRCCYLSEFEEFNCTNLDTGKEILKVKFGVTEEFLDFVTPPSENHKIVAYKSNYTENTLNNIAIIFREQIVTTIKGVSSSRYVFIPVIIQISQKRVLVMVNPNIEGAKEKEHKYSAIAKKYLDEIKLLFDLSWTDIRSKYAIYNYNITLNLTNDIYQLAMGGQNALVENNLNNAIKTSSETIEKFLQNDMSIRFLNEKRQQSSLLNINESIKSVIENAIISDYILGNNKKISELSQIGFMSYLKFEDRTKNLMRMRGEYYTKSIMDSETYLSLRNDLKKYLDITSIRVKWAKDDMKLDVRYQIENLSTLVIFFYDEEFCEDDYNNAIQEYEKFGREVIADIFEMDKMDA